MEEFFIGNLKDSNKKCMWAKQGQELQVNVLELSGAKLGLLSFFKKIIHILSILGS